MEGIMDYFAYASNLSREQMRKLCPDAKPKFSAILPNYKLIFSGCAVYEISDKDLQKLDRFEGYPNNYTHVNVMVFNEDDVAVKAITYIKTRQAEETKPAPEYVAIIRQGLKDWELE